MFSLLGKSLNFDKYEVKPKDILAAYENAFTKKTKEQILDSIYQDVLSLVGHKEVLRY